LLGFFTAYNITVSGQVANLETFHIHPDLPHETDNNSYPKGKQTIKTIQKPGLHF
jgi:hypothetical protein